MLVCSNSSKCRGPFYVGCAGVRAARVQVPHMRVCTSAINII